MHETKESPKVSDESTGYSMMRRSLTALAIVGTELPEPVQALSASLTDWADSYLAAFALETGATLLRQSTRSEGKGFNRLVMTSRLLVSNFIDLLSLRRFHPRPTNPAAHDTL